MKINSAANAESISIVDNKVNKRKEEKNTEAEKSQSKGAEAVRVQVSNRLIVQISPEEILSERANRLEEIRKQVQSGEYFSSRSVTDIAEILQRRMGDEIELTKIFTKDEEE